MAEAAESSDSRPARSPLFYSALFILGFAAFHGITMLLYGNNWFQADSAAAMHTGPANDQWSLIRKFDCAVSGFSNSRLAFLGGLACIVLAFISFLSKRLRKVRFLRLNFLALTLVFIIAQLSQATATPCGVCIMWTP